MFEMEFKFSKLVKIIVFRCLRANKTVGYSEVANYSEATNKINKSFAKENEKKKKKSKSVKTLQIYGWIFSQLYLTNNVLLLESCQLYIIAKYEAINCCIIEAAIQRGSIKKVFFQTLLNSQENSCARVSFLIELQLEKDTPAEVFSCEYF